MPASGSASACNQRLLEPTRYVAAVLDRPHALVVELACPAQHGELPRLFGLDLASAALAARPCVDCRERVRALVRSAPITIICTVSSFD